MPFLIYRDKKRAEGPNHYPYALGMALNEYRVNTEDHYLFQITAREKKNKKNVFLIVKKPIKVYSEIETGLYWENPMVIYQICMIIHSAVI